MLDSGEAKNINFKIDDLNNGSNTIKIKSDNLEYLIPAYIIKGPETPKFSFESSEINLSLLVNYSESRNISIFNSGKETIKNISLSLSSSLKPYVNLSTDLIKDLKSNSNRDITITFFSYKEIHVEGFLKAEQEDKVRFLSISFSSIKDHIPLEENESNETTNESINESINESVPTNPSKTCSELGGTPCGGDLICSVEITEASDDKCCVGGECSERKPSSLKKSMG